jgi:ABC-type multidrug transport system fused ATPase/permease subunit
MWRFLSTRRKQQFSILLMLMIIASLAEVVSVGAVLPFLGVLTAPEAVYQHALIQPLIKFFEISEPKQLILPLSIIFIIATMFAGLVRVTLLYVTTRLSFATGADISISIYRRTLYQDYEVHVGRNTSEVINGIMGKTNDVITLTLTPFLILLSSMILLVGIMSALFFINVNVALSALLGFGILYSIVIFYTRKRLKENSACIADQSTTLIKSLQEGLGGIRNVILDSTQTLYCQLYRKADLPLRRAWGDNQFMTGSPRFVVEAIGMTLIAVLAYTMTQQPGGITAAIPVLGALALGAQRLLPVLQQAFSSYGSIQGSQSSFRDVLELLEQPLPEYAGQPTPSPMEFMEELKLTSLNFRYVGDGPWVLKNVSLSIKKGERVGFVGSTGSGKSTLIDIIMGLLSPTDGDLIIDQNPINNQNRRAWQACIAHVPQNIYLSDSTIAENIALGTPKEKIDHQRVMRAAGQAQLSELIEGWKDGYQTSVGERGIRLSGGQRQRIGIARALYKQANVLIFDEATSALDSDTEQAVMQAIKELDNELTVLIIAHRITTLKDCDKVVKLGKNNTVEILNYEQILASEIEK